MVIGIIGASISGLIAGKRLADVGHDVTVIEKSRTLGGRLSTVELDDIKLDIGLTHFSAETRTFETFVEELLSEGRVKEWAEEFSFYDGTEYHEIDPNADPRPQYVAEDGLQAIAKDLSRWVDVKSQEKAGGLTYIGPDRRKKRSWMINLTDISVFECDAVILATPAVEAYGVLQTVQNKTASRRIIRYIDDIHYNGCVSLAATFDHEVPDFKGIQCENLSLRWISNESSKRGREKAALVLQSTPDFFRKSEAMNVDEMRDRLLEDASKIVGPWALQPRSTALRQWKYFESRNPIDEYFMELELEDAPLALIGDYFGRNTLERAFISGYNLAEYWIKKYSEVTV